MGKLCVVDAVQDQAGTWVIGVTEEDMSFSLTVTDELQAGVIPGSGQYICYDSRTLLDLGIPAEKIYDVQLVYEGNLARAAASQGGVLAHSYIEAQRCVKSHTRVAKASGVDVNKHSLFRMMPDGMLRNLFKLRGEMIFALRDVACAVQGKKTVVEEKMPLMSTIRRIELTGVGVNVPYARSELLVTSEPHETKFFRDIINSAVDGIMYTRYSPVGVKTGRLRVENGFNTMGVAHGRCRDAIVSRHKGGQIYAFDFNAIDYRCIVDSVKEEWFTDLYSDCDDFHSRTMEIISETEAPRDTMKAVTYVHMYGGQVETIVKKSELPEAKVRDIMQRLDDKLWPIKDFRDSLFETGQRLGYVTLPMGRRVPVASDDHPGKVLGLYAQSYSSWVFERALVAVDRIIQNNNLKSRIIFPVHDEIVMDIPQNEEEWSSVFREDMQWAGTETKFTVKLKKGRTYGDATDRS